jgi:uncharacterized membrane protein YqjE
MPPPAAQEEDRVTFIKSPKDFWAGIMYIAFGLATVTIALNYSAGTAGRMGPGYFPRALGSLMMLLGAFLCLRATRIKGSTLSLGSPKPLLVVLGSVVLFGLTVPSLGMALSTLMLVIVSSVASGEFRWKEAVVASLVVAVFAVVVFAYGLGLQMPVWPPVLQ